MWLDIKLMFILLLLVFKVDGSYYLSETKSSWTTKNNICSVAAPPLQLSSAGITVELDESLSAEDDGVWVDYFQILRSFEYIGCLKQASLPIANLIQSTTLDIGSPGQCFEACGYTRVIGIAEQQCFCYKHDHTTENLHSNYTECKTECEYQPGIACGGYTENKDRVMSVYKYHPGVEMETYSYSNITGLFCLRMNPINRALSWFNCSHGVRNMCDFNGAYFPTSSHEQYQSWIFNANTCFRNGGVPIRLKNNYSAPAQVWTNIIRSPVISSSKYTTIRHNLSERIDTGRFYGYIQKKTNAYLLEFTENSSESKKVLCDKERATDSSLIGTYIGASAGGGLVIAAFIIILFLKQRKFQHLCCKKSKIATHGKVPVYDNPGYAVPATRTKTYSENIPIQYVSSRSQKAMAGDVKTHVIYENSRLVPTKQADTTDGNNEGHVEKINVKSQKEDDSTSKQTETIREVSITDQNKTTTT